MPAISSRFRRGSETARVRIKRNSGTPFVIRLSDGTVTVPRFTAYTELRNPKVSVELEVEIDELGRPKCLGCFIDPLDEEGPTGEMERAIPYAKLLQCAAATAASFWSYCGPFEEGHRFDFLMLGEPGAGL